MIYYCIAQIRVTAAVFLIDTIYILSSISYIPDPSHFFTLIIKAIPSDLGTIHTQVSSISENSSITTINIPLLLIHSPSSALGNTMPSTGSPHLSPNLSVHDFSGRGRNTSPRAGALTGRKGYNAPLSAHDLTPPPSRHSHSPLPAHREGLFGRKGYNTPPQHHSDSESHGLSYSPEMGPTFHNGLVGRKGYNAENPMMEVPSHSRSRSISPAPYGSSYREGSLSGRKGYNAPIASSHEASPAPSTASYFQSRSPSPNPHANPASYERKLSSNGALGGRKGYNSSPRLLPGESHHHSGNRGRKGYNMEHDRSFSAEFSAPPEVRKKSHADYNGPVGLGIRDGSLSGRKGYNRAYDSSRSRSVSPLPLH